MSKPIQEALQLINSTKQKMNQILSGPEHVHNMLGINQNLDRVRDRLVMMGAVLDPKPAKDKGEFQPIKNFMGKKVERTNTPPADLNPTDSAKRQYLAKVEKLIQEIGTMHPNAILSSYSGPDDILVLRGVAKKAGIKDFDKAEINTEFIETLIIAVDIYKENQDKNKKVQEFVETKSGKYKVTKEMIGKHSFLTDLKAEPGDTLEVDEEGKYVIHKPKKEKDQK